MSTGPVDPAYYADFSGMEALKQTAQQHQPAAVREAARQFESLFTNMLLKSMREASMGESLGDSEQTRFYQDMFDQQLALQMSQGKGLGLAEHLVQQLQRTGAAPTVAPHAAAGPHLTTREQFIDSIRPYATEAARRLGVAPETIIAHAALETGWGRHLPATAAGSSHNLFGVKAGGHWQGLKADSLTTEFTGSEPGSVRAPFRAYDSIGASMRDYAGLICDHPRFAGALNCGENVAAYAAGLQRGGYATDPAYVQKLVATAAAVRELSAQAVLKNAAALPITAGAEIA